MASRRKATSLEALKRSRSSFNGAITKSKDKLLIMREGGPSATSVMEVKRILLSTSATAERFQVNLDEADGFIASDPNAESLQEEEEEVSEAFEEAVAEVQAIGEELLALNIIATRLSTFTTQLKAVRDTFCKKPEANQDTSLQRLRNSQDSILEDWEKSGLPVEHPMRKDVDHSLSQLTELEAEMAGPKRDGTPAADHAPSPGSTSLREFQQYSKIPERGLPKFNGDVMAWAEFWANFQSQVGSKDYLNEFEKLGYLQSCITDPEATEMLHCPRQKPGMYLEMVERLTNRYDRVTEIHRTLVNKITTMDPARHNRLEMRRLLTSFQNTMDSIERTGFNDMSHFYSSRLYHLLPLDVQTRWDHHTANCKNVPQVKDMLSYLNKHTEGLPAKPVPRGRSEPAAELKPQKKKFEKQKAVHIGTSTPATPPSAPATPTQSQPRNSTAPPPFRWECSLCPPERHPLFICPKWLALTVAQRKKHATTKKMCLNCLAIGHDTDKCWSKYKCRECGGHHHTTLHQPATPINAATVQPQDVGDLLITSRVLIIGADGRRRQARALLDTGAAMNLLSTRMAESLQLPMTRASISFKRAMGGEMAHSSHTAEFTITDLREGRTGLQVRAAVVEHVADDMPVLETPPAEDFPHLRGLELADPLYHLPDRIDLILGLSAFLKLVDSHQLVEGPPGTPTAVHTIFGWGVGGALTQDTGCQVIPMYTSTPAPIDLTDQTPNHQDFHQFWQGEELEGITGAVAPTEDIIEQHYLDHVQYSDTNKRYTVALPRREDTFPLGDSRPQALARFLNQERSLIRRNTYAAYQEVLQEYLTLGHAEVVPSETALPPQHFYMPMHAVVKETSTTTKLRVVFDGSALTSSGVSLNQTLHSGPTIQPTLTQTLLRFRSYPIGLSADISKMYREVELEEGDRDSHRFLWRKGTVDPVTDYRMTRVTFGISSSPFLAIRTLNQIAEDHGADDPEVQHHIRESFYVDDFLGGAGTVSEAGELPTRLRAVLSQGGMNLCKWRCSQPSALNSLPDHLKEKLPVKSLDNHTISYSKTLGIDWNTERDTMFPDLTLPTNYSKTKRGLMSDISRVFDILGWVSPAILQMKVQYQELWALEIGWDDSLPKSIEKKHSKWRAQLPILAEHQLPRPYYLGAEQTVTIELHGFADASMKAYGAVCYLRSTYQHHPPLIRLVTSKTKVAPRVKPSNNDSQPKGLSISRLELCGAHLLSKLLLQVMTTLKISVEQVHAWTDSSCVLSWLDGNPRDYQVFVTNRVAQILDTIPPQHWKHIPTGQNPADAASRGMYPAELAQHQLWWEGPDLLHQEPLQFPPQPPRRPLCVPELRAAAIHTVSVQPAIDIEDRCLVYHKLLRCAAWWVRYMGRLKPGSHSPSGSTLTLTELRKAEQLLVRRAQQRCFPKEMKSLLTIQTILPSSKLTALTPFLDSENSLRVGGRLSHSALTSNQRHPLILDAKDKLTKCYFTHLHVTLGHCGPSLLLCHSGLRYHILGARRLAKTVCGRCTTCIKLSKATRSQLMGQLPADRVTPAPPFYITGVDYAGPFKLKLGYTRKPTIITAHVAVFLCFTTRAVHLELVSDQTTEAFLATLKRFISRRGCPHTIYSDNGGNFQGAKNDLRALQKMVREATPAAEAYLLTKEINWKNSPALSPHFGGLWEAGVKSMKYHLRRTVGAEKLTYEEFTTVLCQVEALLNSRPLLPLHSHSPEGISARTAGHFLIGRPLTAYPETAIEVEPSRLKAWNKCQALVQSFKTRWVTEYLRSLQARSKWQHPSENIEVGDIVVLREVSPYKKTWPLAKVLQVFPGADGKVRVVLLKTESTTFKRPIHKVALLHREEAAEPEDTVESSPGRMLRSKTPTGPLQT